MNYLFSIVLIFFDTVYCESGKQLHNVQPNKKTVANVQVSDLVELNHISSNKTTVAVDTRQNTVYKTSKESKNTSKTFENDLQFFNQIEQNRPGKNKYQNLEERHKTIYDKTRQSEEENQSFLNTSKLTNDMKQNQTFRQFRPVSVKAEALISKPKTSKATDGTEKTIPNLSDYVNFEVVDSQMSKDTENKTEFDRDELSNNTYEPFLQNRNYEKLIQHDVTEIVSEDSKLSMEVNLRRTSMQNKPFIINMQSPTYNDVPYFRNERVDSTTRKVRKTAKRQPWSSKIYSHYYNTDDWNPYLRSFKKTQYTKPYNVRAVNNNPKFRNRKLKNKKPSPKKKYEDSFEEDNAKFLSKNEDISNSQYSLENIDRPPTKNIRHTIQPVNSNENIFLKAQMDVSDTATEKKYFKNDLTIDDKSVGKLTTIVYEVEKMPDTNIYDEINTELTEQYETQAVITEPKKAVRNTSGNRMKQRIFKKKSMKHAPKWRKLIYASSYSDEEDVLIRNINKALKTSP